MASGRTTQHAGGERAGRLDTTSWVNAALDVAAELGLGAVAVEPVARRIGATKGSFYWHFPNRDALVVAVLERWRSIATQAVIELLEATADPLIRLHRLARITNRSEWEDRLEYAILGAADDPLVRPFVEQVNREREAYVSGVFRDLGYSRTVADRRASMVLHAYVGRLRLEHGHPRPTAARATAYNRELVELLTADRPQR